MESPSILGYFTSTAAYSCCAVLWLWKLLCFPELAILLKSNVLLTQT